MLSKAIYLFIPLTAGLAFCQRPLSTGKSRADFIITRLHCRNTDNNPSVSGIVYVKNETGVHQWPGPILRFDGQVFLHVKADGSYESSLTPGIHEIVAGQVGYSVIKINPLALEKGDSIRIDFLLHADEKPGLY